ncbi:MAG: oxidoreductase [Deltaproteobacteria bacterium]|nr:MAG: oxidoreductase [Deltaproteobacteria bacterium]
MEQNTERCKSCGYCVLTCPKKALSFSETTNSRGYTTVALDTEKCIVCGICYSVCPDYVYERREK